MKKNTFLRNNIAYIIIILLLITYAIFPATYAVLSQRIFTTIYIRNAQLLEKKGSMQLPNRQVSISGNVFPLHVIARPPQTPYDFFITSVLPKREEENTHYVYDSSLIPIGYIQKKYPAVYVVVLFSAPKSREQFAVNEYVTTGIGDGGGSFSMQVPADIPITVGMPITHQATGAIISAVALVRELPEKNIQQVTGVLHSNPLEIATLYVKREEEKVIVTPEVLEEVIQATKNASADTEEAVQ